LWACLAVLAAAAVLPWPASARVSAFWRQLAHCETGGRWNWGRYAHSPARRPGEGSTFEGGLGFYYGTWTMWRKHVGVRYLHAWQAPPAVQVRVAAWGLAHGGYWGCLRRVSRG
jgi:hypothetical protein